jgi:hypothetical protein
MLLPKLVSNQRQWGKASKVSWQKAKFGNIIVFLSLHFLVTAEKYVSHLNYCCLNRNKPCALALPRQPYCNLIASVAPCCSFLSFTALFSSLIILVLAHLEVFFTGLSFCALCCTYESHQLRRVLVARTWLLSIHRIRVL